MLDLGGLKAGEKMFDLGMRRRPHRDHGRAEVSCRCHRRRDWTDDLVRQSMQKIRSLGLQKTARIIYGDILSRITRRRT